MFTKERIEAFVKLGEIIDLHLKNDDYTLRAVLKKSFEQNPWFDEYHVRYALRQISNMLKLENLNLWTERYDKNIFKRVSEKRILVIMAGNIPLVGFHDFLCVLISGNIFIGKQSSDDTILWPFIVNILCSIDNWFENRVFLKDNIKGSFDAVIATGSDNTSRYFDYYFGKYPHIIRRNRNSIAVLNGSETKEDLEMLADDIALYYGKGCRSISKIFVPNQYDFSALLKALSKYSHFSQHHKYFNNYEYQKAVSIINNNSFYDTGFYLLRNEKSLLSPISVLHYDYYDDTDSLIKYVNAHKNLIQCVVSDGFYIQNTIPFGKGQQPELWDYADGIDTLRFLSEI